MKKIVFIVGSGFSAGFTCGVNPIIGNRPMPVLSELSNALLDYLSDIIQNESLEDIPFSSETIKSVITILTKNEKLPPKERFDFEQLISLLSIGTYYSSSESFQRLKQSYHFESREEVLRCLIYFIPSLFAKHLCIDGELKKNRNLFYTVNNHETLYAFQRQIRHLVDNNDVTFISFNYDGLLEAFLDSGLGSSPMVETPQKIRYLPRISHGIPMSLPEYVFDRTEMRKTSNYCIPLVLKPHGSMHFYQVDKEISNLCNTTTLVALHPHFDTEGFNESTMKRDIDSISFWKYANPVPFIIPPVLNKESYLSLDYSKLIMNQMFRVLSEAELIISVGFSIPRSDMHINAFFQLVADASINKDNKRIGLIYKSGTDDATLSNWTRIFGNKNVSVINDGGLSVSSVKEIDDTWEVINNLI